ncbi:FtsX-like permease family protein [Luteibacter anthropi]|uniref:FtsX-like permease family protein n=2 Tax=Luteibacter anthropi TaxID=564369 RepID=A0A7X5UCU0_9GAMM|nr:ABC transporter permease [Luteibacter anthropi]NII07959.1 FtsX-like permease family protein [Luteibacter anthropi]
MLGYFDIALRSLRRNLVLTGLMVIAIALGIGAAMTTLTTFYVLSGDPIPAKSHRLFYPQLDPATMQGFKQDGEPAAQMTRYDAQALLRDKRADRQAAMSGGTINILPDGHATKSLRVQARYTSADFFAMFDAPMLAGRSWNADDDQAHARVAVIGRDLSEKLFGGSESIGRTFRTPQGMFRVVGVLDEWSLNPRFYDLGDRRFSGTEQVFLPLSTSIDLRLDTEGTMDCWGTATKDAEGKRAMSAPCAWLQYWVELDAPEKVAGYRQYLDDYAVQQHQAGRYERPANTRLRNVMQWLDYNHVVPSDVRIQTWLAFGFLLVCLVNTAALLMAKFTRRATEIGIHRALGATRIEIFKQCLAEASFIGIAGGVLGIAFATVGLWLVRQQPDDYARLAQFSLPMLVLTFVLSQIASLLAGLLPAWRMTQVEPALQMKVQ